MDNWNKKCNNIVKLNAILHFVFLRRLMFSLVFIYVVVILMRRML